MSQVASTSQETDANHTSSKNNPEPIKNETIGVLQPVKIVSVSTNKHLKENTSTDNVVTTQNLSKEQVTCPRGHRLCAWYQTQAQMSSALKKLENLSQAINSDHKLQSNTLYCNRGNFECTKLEDEFYFFGLNVAAQMRNIPLDVALKVQTEIQNILCLARIQAQMSNTTTKDNRNSLRPQDTDDNDKYEADLQNEDENLDEDFDLLDEDVHLDEDEHSPGGSQ